VKRRNELRARRAELRADAALRRAARFDALVTQAAAELARDIAHTQRVHRYVQLLSGAIAQHADEVRA
jgi:hypothetical protein